MNKITGDFAKMAAQVPALFESLSGMSMTELLGKVRAIGDKAVRPDVLPPANGGKSKPASEGR
jgi:flotillin